MVWVIECLSLRVWFFCSLSFCFKDSNGCVGILIFNKLETFSPSGFNTYTLLYEWLSFDYCQSLTIVKMFRFLHAQSKFVAKRFLLSLNQVDHSGRMNIIWTDLSFIWTDLAYTERYGTLTKNRNVRSGKDKEWKCALTGYCSVLWLYTLVFHEEKKVALHTMAEPAVPPAVKILVFNEAIR